MSFADAVEDCPSFSMGYDSGIEAFVRHSWKETERKTWKIVSLRVPGTADRQKSSSVPGVIRICREPHSQKKPRKTLNRIDFVIVPDMRAFAAPEERQTFSSSCIPSIKRCSQEEIEAIKSPLKGVARKSKTPTEKGRKRTQRHSEVHKHPLRHPQAPRTHIMTGTATQG